MSRELFGTISLQSGHSLIAPHTTGRDTVPGSANRTSTLHAWVYRLGATRTTVFFGLGGNGTFGLGATGNFKIRFILMFYVYVWCLFIYSCNVTNRNKQ